MASGHDKPLFKSSNPSYYFSHEDFIKNLVLIRISSKLHILIEAISYNFDSYTFDSCRKKKLGRLFKTNQKF